MTYEERLALIRRIARGQFYFSIVHKEHSVFLLAKDPNPELLSRADLVWQSEYAKAVDAKLMTNEEFLESCEARGVWTKKNDGEIETAQKEISNLQERRKSFQYRKRVQAEIDGMIVEQKKKIMELVDFKESLLINTAEGVANTKKDEFVLANSVFVPSGKKFFGDNPLNSIDVDLVIEVKNKLMDNLLTVKQIRKIARTNPWRVMWMSAEQCGSLFGSSAVEMTANQLDLCYWSKVYDMAFNALESPSDEVLEDDNAFDAWMTNYINESKKQSSTDSPIKSDGKNITIQEVFEFADREGAEEVYDKNSDVTKEFVTRQARVIKERGGKARDIEVLANLPQKKGKGQDEG